MSPAFLWLDFLIFGNGFGLGAPHHDQVFYWLSGDLYTWVGGHGAQLSSRQWWHPKPGERRRLAGQDFVPFLSQRTRFRVEVSWRMVDFPQGINDANAAIARLKQKISGEA